MLIDYAVVAERQLNDVDDGHPEVLLAFYRVKRT